VEFGPPAAQDGAGAFVGLQADDPHGLAEAWLQEAAGGLEGRAVGAAEPEAAEGGGGAAGAVAALEVEGAGGGRDDDLRRQVGSLELAAAGVTGTGVEHQRSPV
jgi:hypothetical protein